MQPPNLRPREIGSALRAVDPALTTDEIDRLEQVGLLVYPYIRGGSVQPSL